MNHYEIKYNYGLEQYKKTKPVKTKTLEFGMKLLSSAPTWASDSASYAIS